MAETTPTEPNVPSPDPDVVERTLQSAIDKVSARKGYYIALAILVLGALVAVMVLANPDPEQTQDTAFATMWSHASDARDKLRRDTSAREELALLEGSLEEARGTAREGTVLWLLGIYNYAEAYTSDKASFEERRPHLAKAAAFLKELQAEKFDNLLLAKPQWFSSERQAPVDVLYTQVQADLKWQEQFAHDEPTPDADTVAVLRTAEGDIHLKFFAKLAPEHVHNFLTLAALGTYNGTQFHFVSGGNQDPDAILGGDPFTFFYPKALDKKHILRWGNGSLGYDLPPEEARFRIVHRRGIVTSQRIRDADWDNAVQFRIMLRADRKLDRVHTPFAKVVEGMSIVDAIAKKRTASESDQFKDQNDFATQATADLLVEPVLVFKVIVYKAGKAVEHKFALTDEEKTIDGLKMDGKPIPEKDIYAGRLLRDVRAKDKPRRGLDVPFPADIDTEAKPPPDPKGER